MAKIKLSRFDEDNPLQHMMKVLFGCGLMAGFRGCTEHTFFTREQVEFGTYGKNHLPEELRGINYVAITHMQDKTKKLSVYNSYQRDTGHHLRFPIVEEDPDNFAASLMRLVGKMSPGQSRIYCQPGSASYCKTLEMNGYLNACFMFNKPLGPKSVTSLFKKGASILGLPENFRPHSLRAAFITKMANDPSVSISETMLAAHHNSVAASANYQRADGYSEINRLRAIGAVAAVPATTSTKTTKAEGCSLMAVTESQIDTTPIRQDSTVPEEPQKKVSGMVLVDSLKASSPAIVTPPKKWHPSDDIEVMSVGDVSFNLLADHFDTLSISEWSHMHEDVEVAKAGEMQWTQDWEVLGEDEGKGEVAEPIVLKGRKKEEERSGEGEQEVSLTQVGIDDLETEIRELKDVVLGKKRPSTPKPVSKNQKMISSLREEVRKLKRKIDDREHEEEMYRDSLEAMEEQEKDELREKLRRERQRNDRLEAENDDYDRLIGGISERSRSRRYGKKRY